MNNWIYFIWCYSNVSDMLCTFENRHVSNEEKHFEWVEEVSIWESRTISLCEEIDFFMNLYIGSMGLGKKYEIDTKSWILNEKKLHVNIVFLSPCRVFGWNCHNFIIVVTSIIYNFIGIVSHITYSYMKPPGDQVILYIFHKHINQSDHNANRLYDAETITFWAIKDSLVIGEN